jgi:hypothetical protein
MGQLIPFFHYDDEELNDVGQCTCGEVYGPFALTLARGFHFTRDYGICTFGQPVTPEIERLARQIASGDDQL